MPENIIFYIIFLSQILLISYYYPKQVLDRMTTVLEKHPPDQYPKLYPRPHSFYTQGQKRYRVLNHVILALGFGLLIAIGYWDYSTGGEINNMIPFGYWMIQGIPMFLLEILGYSRFKLMRAADVSGKRRAVLNPRRLFNFVSPRLFGLAIFMYVACILFFYSIHGFQIHPSNDTFIIFVTLTLMNLLFTAIIVGHLRGKKRDPHQAHDDRIKQSVTSIKSLFIMSVVASFFIITTEGMQAFHLDFYRASLMSAYLQLTIVIGLGALLRKTKLEEINFDVYRKEV